MALSRSPSAVSSPRLFVHSVSNHLAENPVIDEVFRGRHGDSLAEGAVFLAGGFLERCIEPVLLDGTLDINAGRCWVGGTVSLLGIGYCGGGQN